MGVALFLIGILAVLTGIVMFIIALVKKRGWGVIRSLVLGGVGIVLLIVGVAVGVTEESKKPETIAPSPPAPGVAETPATTEAGKSRFSPVPFGSSLTCEDERVTILSSKRLYSISYDRAEQGETFLVITIRIDFLGDPQQKKHYLSTLKYRVVGSKGQIYDAEWWTETDTPLKGGEFYGGSTTSGDLVYEVNEEETSFVLIWNCVLGQDRYFEIP